MADLARCSIDGCSSAVNKPGHTLCYEHWKASRVAKEESASYSVNNEAEAGAVVSKEMLSSTALGEHFKLDAKQTNRLLVDLGWIEKDGKGWAPTELGKKLKAEHVLRKDHAPRVVWHQGICKSRILQNAVNELLAIEMATPSQSQVEPSPEDAADKSAGFRDKFPAPHRTNDGHFVRSMPEIQIDNWLYEKRIAHAYERLVPVDETMYCDFYLPEHRVYIEYWGMESNPRYKARKNKKLEIYKENDFRLIEIQKEHISNLDDYLTPLLVKLGYKLM